MKRSVLLSFVLLALFGVAIGCGEDSDPITSACETGCEIEKSHPCASQEEQCIADCKRDATGIQNGFTTDCAVCIAKTIEYSVKDNCTDGPDCCWGALRLQQPQDVPECLSSCFEPDAGVAY